MYCCFGFFFFFIKFISWFFTWDKLSTSFINAYALILFCYFYFFLTMFHRKVERKIKINVIFSCILLRFCRNYKCFVLFKIYNADFQYILDYHDLRYVLNKVNFSIILRCKISPFNFNFKIYKTFSVHHPIWFVSIFFF